MMGERGQTGGLAHYDTRRSGRALPEVLPSSVGAMGLGGTPHGRDPELGCRSGANDCVHDIRTAYRVEGVSLLQGAAGAGCPIHSFPRSRQ